MKPLRRRILVWIALVGLGCLLAAGSSAQIYRWTDAQGREHFTQDLQQVPPAKRQEAEAAAARSAASPSRLQTFEAPASRPSSSSVTSRRRGSKRLLQIPFHRRGNTMFVKVRINDQTDALFMVDTGASDVLIPAAVAQEAGIYVGPNTPRNTYQTANGLVTQPVVTIDAVEVGDVRVEKVQGSISESLQVGLLGGTFFNRFTFQIDPGAHVITLVPNDRTRGGLSEAQWRERFRETRGRLVALERYLDENNFTRDARVAQLERNRETMQGELDALEVEADQADVPQAWRE